MDCIGVCLVVGYRHGLYRIVISHDLPQWAVSECDQSWVTAVACIGVWSVVVNHSIGVSDGENKLFFQWDDDEIRFVVDQHAELDFYSAS